MTSLSSIPPRSNPKSSKSRKTTQKFTINDRSEQTTTQPIKVETTKPVDVLFEDFLKFDDNEKVLQQQKAYEEAGRKRRAAILQELKGNPERWYFHQFVTCHVMPREYTPQGGCVSDASDQLPSAIKEALLVAQRPKKDSTTQSDASRAGAPSPDDLQPKLSVPQEYGYNREDEKSRHKIRLERLKTNIMEAAAAMGDDNEYGMKHLDPVVVITSSGPTADWFKHDNDTKEILDFIAKKICRIAVTDTITGMHTTSNNTPTSSGGEKCVSAGQRAWLASEQRLFNVVWYFARHNRLPKLIDAVWSEEEEDVIKYDDIISFLKEYVYHKCFGIDFQIKWLEDQVIEDNVGKTCLPGM